MTPSASPSVHLPLLLAAVMTALNLVKPAVVDDAAYLAMARHISLEPLDPYGFTQFWYTEPEPAMGVLAPPVVPYMVAAGYAVCGNNLPLLKLTLFPVVWLFTASAYALFRRFAHGTEAAATTLLAMSPAVLPMVNVMLDVPALGFGLAAVAVFVRGVDHRRPGLWVAAGMLSGIAMQTKYTMLTLPVVLAGYAVCRGRLGPGVVAAGVGLAVFSVWELLLVAKYGESHFLHHAAGAAGGSLADVWAAKLDLGRPLLTYAGGLGFGWALFAGRAAGVPRAGVRLAAVFAATGLFAVAIPAPVQWLTHTLTGTDRRLSGLPAFGPTVTLFQLMGVTLGGVIAVGLGRLLARRGPVRLRWDADTVFLGGWLAVEIAAYFALTPFPAGRRVMTVVAVVGLIAARSVSRLGRLDPTRRPERWVVPAGVAAGVGLAMLDTFDAYPEKVLADRAAAVVASNPDDSGRVWTQGHWGWQYYTTRHGFTPVVPGRTELHPGDWFVRPVRPTARGFFRPQIALDIVIDPAAVELVRVDEWDDVLRCQTVPTLYGGDVPLLGRDFPRLTVAVYRVTRPWVPAADLAE